jgi:hypothetical protein
MGQKDPKYHFILFAITTGTKHKYRRERERGRENYLLKYSLLRIQINEVEKIVRNWRSISSNHPNKDATIR